MGKMIPRSMRRQECRRRLGELIGTRNLWGQPLMGERELGQEFGVSRTTIRYVLADLEREGLVTRRHGAQTCVCDKPGGKAKTRTRRIAVICWYHYEDNEAWEFRSEIAKGFLSQCTRESIEPTVLALNIPEEAARARQASEMRQYDAFVAIGVDDYVTLSFLVELNRGPVILLDGYLRSLPVTMVVDDGFEAMRRTGRHLVAQGHERIAFIDCYNRAVNNPEKYAGYAAALMEKGLPVDPKLVAVPKRGGETRQGITQKKAAETFVRGAVKKFLSLPNAPTALIGFDDSRAVVAMQELERRGLRVGKDFAVAGCGDAAIRKGITDRLTSARFYPLNMGREAARAVKNQPHVDEGQMIFVKSRLFIRQSSGGTL